VGKARLPATWVSEEVGRLRNGLFASPQLAKSLGPAPVPVAKIRELSFISPVYSHNGQYVVVDDDCPLAYGDRKLGHEAQTFGLGLDLAAASDQVVFGPVIAASGHLEHEDLVEIRVEGWNVTDALTLACAGDRVTARAQRAIIAAIREGLSELGG